MDEDCPLYPFFGDHRLLVFAHDYPAGSHQHRHRHDAPQLLHAARGVMRASTPTGYWVIPPGRGVWIPAFEPHEIRMVGPVSMRTLYVGADLADGFGTDCSVIDISPLLQELLEALAGAEQISETELPRRHALEELALIEVRRADRLKLHVPMPEDARLRRLCERTLERPGDETLDVLAEESGASVRTMRRLFQQELGMSFAAWRQQARLVEALALLGEGRAVADVAQELGYAGPSAFSAMFRQATGFRPGQVAGMRVSLATAERSAGDEPQGSPAGEMQSS
jgi:AraC-like DNA-binding protein